LSEHCNDALVTAPSAPGGSRFRIASARLAVDPTRATVRDMTVQGMHNVGIVVEDLAAAIGFFTALGLVLEGEMPVEGRWMDQVVGLDGVRVEVAMMRTPDGHSRLELTRFLAPAAISAQPNHAPANALGLRRITFAVTDIDDTVGRLRGHGGELVGEIAEYEDRYRMCYVRGPAGIIVALGQPLG
jgi:catechol 2,3-dioxygenase-like lactoylglutathione lyase family enzyme